MGFSASIFALLAFAALLAPAYAPPSIRVDRSAANWHVYKPPLKGPYSDVAVGPDGNVWVSSTGDKALARLDYRGRAHLLPMNFKALTLAAGGDGRIYMTQQLPHIAIGAITLGGKLSILYYENSKDDDVFYDTELALGADGNMWFGELDHLAKLTPTGDLTEIPYFYGERDNGGVSLFATKSRVYYTVCCQITVDGTGGLVGYYDFPTRSLTEYPVTPEVCNSMSGLGIAGDGHLYVLCSYSGFQPSEILRIDGPGNTRFAFPYYGPIYSSAGSTVIGPDGNIWFAPGTGGVLVRFDVATKTFDQYFTPDGSSPSALTVGSDGNIWTVARSSVDVFLVKHPR
jgi:hypothetical protein